MKRKPPAAKPLEKPLARITITEMPPDANQILQLIKNDPAQLRKIIQEWIKDRTRELKARNNRRRAIEKALNETARKDAQQDKSIALKLATKLDRALLRRGKISEAARRLQRLWPNGRTPPSIRSLCRYLTEK